MTAKHLTAVLAVCGFAGLLTGGLGCASFPGQTPKNPSLYAQGLVDAAPRELHKTVLPEYTIEPPDILQIDAVRTAPKAPYSLRTYDIVQLEVERSPSDMLQPGDVVQLFVPGAFQHAPIDGHYIVQPSGAIDLGSPYGSVRVAGMLLPRAKEAIEAHLGPGIPPEILKDPSATLARIAASQPIRGNYMVQLGGVVNLGVPYGAVRVAGYEVEQAQAAIQHHLGQFFVEPRVTATVVQSGSTQEIAGQHMVGPDGMVSLGSYGSVSVVGLTLNQAKWTIEAHLSHYLEMPEVAVSVFAYNSKVYYLITQGAGMGDGVYRFPVTGNDTVLDAVAQIQGLQPVSSKKIWIARPNPCTDGYQILAVDWHGITAMANAETNYQILPGDRVFVAEDKLIALDTSLAKIIAPMERIMGFTILGVSTATRLSGNVLAGGGNPRGGF